MGKLLLAFCVFTLSACSSLVSVPRVPQNTDTGLRSVPQVVQSYGANRWTVFPGSRSPYTMPAGEMTADTHGNVWYVNVAGVGRLNYSGTQAFFTYYWLYAFSQNGGLGGWGPGITFGPDGNVWVVNAFDLARFTPDGSLTTYPNENRYNYFGYITAGFHSDLWWVQDNDINQLDLNSGDRAGAFLQPKETGLGITRGPDGNVWFITQNTVGRANLPPGQFMNVTSFKIPGVGRSAYAGTGIVTGPNNHLFTVRQDCTSYELTTRGTIVAVRRLGPAGANCSPQPLVANNSIWEVSNGVSSSCDAHNYLTELQLPSGALKTTTPPNSIWGRPPCGSGATNYAPEGGALGGDGNLYFNMANGNIGVRILASITVAPNVALYTFPAVGRSLTLTISETNYAGAWTVTATDPNVVRVGRWLAKNQVQIESAGRGRGRILIHDEKNNYYNFFAVVQ